MTLSSAATADVLDQEDVSTAGGEPSKDGFSWGRALAWFVVAILLLVTLFPFYWMLRTAFSNGVALGAHSSSLLPADFTLGAFKRVLGFSTVEEAQAQGGSGASVPFWSSLRNSIIISVVITVGQVGFSAMAAYAFSRLQWPGRNLVFAVFLAALMIPPIFISIPNFLLMKDLGLLKSVPGNLTAMILPFFFMTPFAIFFLRQFFLGISKEVEEAAKLDGASHSRIFFRVILPMSEAPIVTLAILTYIGAWNEYFWPLLVSTQDGSRPLTLALGIFRSQTPGGSPDWPGLMAMTLLAALPIMILYFIFGKKVVNSIQFSGIK
jgi:multiple sugar transport system permease protein